MLLEQAIEQRGLPESIRCDNGPELTSRHFLAWCEERKIQLIHIQPGRPMQNGHVESFVKIVSSGKSRSEWVSQKAWGARVLLDKLISEAHNRGRVLSESWPLRSLGQISRRVDTMYARVGRPSIAPEKLERQSYA